MAAARAADPKTLIVDICDERLRFLQSLKTWPVFGRGWGRRVAEVKLKALGDGSGCKQVHHYGPQVNESKQFGKYSMWNKIRSWFKNSVTILWARLQVLLGLLVACLMALASDPNVTGAIQAALQPKYVPYYVTIIGLITEIARRRMAGSPH